MSNEQKANTENGGLPEWFESHPMTLKIREERAAEILARRQEAADMIEHLRNKAEAVIPVLQAEEDRIRAALAEHDERWKILRSNLNAATMALNTERQRAERETRQAESVLYETSPPEIDETIHQVRDRHELLLRKKPDHDRSTGETNIFKMTKEMFFRTNAPSISHALRYCIDAIAELQKMKLTPVLDIDRIESLKKGIPDINEMREMTGDKPLPQIDTGWRHRFPSDDQLDWELGRLNEKFKQIMKK